MIPDDLSGLSYDVLADLYKRTGSKRVAAALRRFAAPPVATSPIPPAVAPRPPQPKSAGFRPAKFKQK
jgi:hypothetical protein